MFENNLDCLFGHYQRRNELFFFTVDQGSKQIVLKKAKIDDSDDVEFEVYKPFGIPDAPNSSSKLIGVTIVPNLDENVKFYKEDGLDFHFACVYTDENSCFIYYQI